MARALREVETGVCFHVINRGNNRQEIFKKPGDYAAFLTVLTIALGRFDIELLGYCLMPNHWHLIIRARPSGSIPNFTRWLTLTYVRRHHAHCEGEPGQLYQGRYKSFPVEEDDHFLVLCRYVESNPLRAKMVPRAELWEWSSLHQRQTRQPVPPLADWPVDRPKGWPAVMNEDLSGLQLASVATSLSRGRPLGSTQWVQKIAGRLNLQQTVSPLGRPCKPDDAPIYTPNRAKILGIRITLSTMDQVATMQKTDVAYTNQTPWTPPRISAEMEDRPGVKGGFHNWFLNTLSQCFVTQARCIQGADSEKLYGQIYWDHDLDSKNKSYNRHIDDGNKTQLPASGTSEPGLKPIIKNNWGRPDYCRGLERNREKG